MHLTPWAVIGLVALAAILAAFALGDSFAATSCNDQDDSFANHLTSQALNGYEAIGADEPDSDCAATGLANVARRLCRRAHRLLGMHAFDEAAIVYHQALAIGRPREGFDCAGKGLAKLEALEHDGDEG